MRVNLSICFQLKPAQSSCLRALAQCECNKMLQDVSQDIPEAIGDGSGSSFEILKGALKGFIGPLRAL